MKFVSVDLSRAARVDIDNLCVAGDLDGWSPAGVELKLVIFDAGDVDLARSTWPGRQTVSGRRLGRR